MPRAIIKNGMASPSEKTDNKSAPGSAPEDVDSAIDSLVPSRILVKVIPIDGTKSSKSQAERLARAGRGVIEAWRRPRDKIRELVVDMAMKRYAVARVIFDERLWSDDTPKKMTAKRKQEDLDRWAKRHRNELPIRLDRRPPRFTRWREVNDRMVIVVEDYWTTVLEAKQVFWKFPKARSYLLQKDPFDSVRISDVWYEDWRAIALDDRPIFPGDDGILEHGYDEIPYVSAAFRELTFDEPGKRFRGVLSNAEGLYPAESRVLSMQLTMLAFNAWRTHVGHTVDGREIRIIPGHYIDIDKNRGEYLELLRGDPVPDELLRTEGVLDQLIQRNSASATARGTENARSAQQLYAQQAIRGLRTESARDALQRLLEKALGLVMMEIETIVGVRVSMPYPVKAKDTDFGIVSIGPKDIDGYWGGFRVNFGRRIDPATMEQAKAIFGWVQNKAISWETGQEIAEIIDDIPEEEERLILESVDRLPFMIETQALEKVKNYYGDSSWEYQTLKKQIEEGRVRSADQSTQQPSNIMGNVSGQDLNKGAQPSSSQGGVTAAGQPAGGG